MQCLRSKHRYKSLVEDNRQKQKDALPLSDKEVRTQSAPVYASMSIQEVRTLPSAEDHYTGAAQAAAAPSLPQRRNPQVCDKCSHYRFANTFMHQFHNREGACLVPPEHFATREYPERCKKGGTTCPACLDTSNTTPHPS
jgi:hypothetical protein